MCGLLSLKGCGDTCAGRGGDKGECAEGCVAQESRKQKEKHSGASVVCFSARCWEQGQGQRGHVSDTLARGRLVTTWQDIRVRSNEQG